MPLRDLFDRNVAWAEGKTRTDPHYFRRMAEQQSPAKRGLARRITAVYDLDRF